MLDLRFPGSRTLIDAFTNFQISMNLPSEPREHRRVWLLLAWYSDFDSLLNASWPCSRAGIVGKRRRRHGRGASAAGHDTLQAKCERFIWFSIYPEPRRNLRTTELDVMHGQHSPVPDMCVKGLPGTPARAWLSILFRSDDRHPPINCNEIKNSEQSAFHNHKLLQTVTPLTNVHVRQG